jgi:hypothetical protein
MPRIPPRQKFSSQEADFNISKVHQRHESIPNSVLIRLYHRENGYPVIDLLVNNGNDNAVREDFELLNKLNNWQFAKFVFS